MPDKFVLALDQGTSSSRAIVFDTAGTIRGVAQQEFRQIFPEPGWVEHDAEEIWTTQRAMAEQAIANAGIDASDISAIGITNQRETVVVWDRATGKPIANAIVWQDRRTTEYMASLEHEGHLSLVQERTGLLLDPYFSGSKLRWILDNVPGARERAEKGELAAGTIDSWLVWCLTGGKVHATDVTNASRTLLCNDRLAIPGESHVIVTVPGWRRSGFVAAGDDAGGPGCQIAVAQVDVRADRKHRVGNSVIPGNGRIAWNMRTCVDMPEAAAMAGLLPWRITPAGIGYHMAVFAQQRFDNVQDRAGTDGLLGQCAAIEHLVAEVLVFNRIADTLRATVRRKRIVHGVQFLTQCRKLGGTEYAFQSGKTPGFEFLAG